jgi:hypothetical protein
MILIGTIGIMTIGFMSDAFRGKKISCIFINNVLEYHLRYKTIRILERGDLILFSEYGDINL